MKKAHYLSSEPMTNRELVTVSTIFRYHSLHVAEAWASIFAIVSRLRRSTDQRFSAGTLISASTDVVTDRTRGVSSWHCGTRRSSTARLKSTLTFKIVSILLDR